mgnify:CR=1 FL=1
MRASSNRFGGLADRSPPPSPPKTTELRVLEFTDEEREICGFQSRSSLDVRRD